MVNLRPATVDDVEFLGHVLYRYMVDTLHQVAEESWDAGSRDDALQQVQGKVPNSITYVIEKAGERVGRLRLVRTPGLMEIAGLQILPDHQNRGIGTAVVTDVLSEGQQRSVAVELDVNVDNPNAERLYVRLGFRRIGRKDNDYRMRTNPRRS
jgi:ribosomal protein S18 acetylase RimI-like enzyme